MFSVAAPDDQYNQRQDVRDRIEQKGRDIDAAVLKHQLNRNSSAEKQGSGDADKFIDLLVEVRSEVRKQKLWGLSDLIRDKLKELGVTIEDSKDGTKWRWG